MYKCPYCNKNYQCKNNFSSHFWRCHKIKYKEYFDTFIEPWFHKCPYCEKERGFHKGKYFTTCCSSLCKRKADVDTKLKNMGMKNIVIKN